MRVVFVLSISQLLSVDIAEERKHNIMNDS